MFFLALKQVCYLSFPCQFWGTDPSYEHDGACALLYVVASVGICEAVEMNEGSILEEL